MIYSFSTFVRHGLASWLVACFSIWGVVSTASAQTCYDFEGSAPGTSWSFGDVMTYPDTTVSLNGFQNAGGAWIQIGTATVVQSNYAGGTSNQELEVDRVNVRSFPHQPASASVSFRYADRGGNVNLGVNGDFRNVADLVDLDGQLIGGCLVQVTESSIAGDLVGEVSITPDSVMAVAVFGFGGQNLFVDDVCHSP